MSGHSKWATIKHQKGAKDKVRAKVFAKVLRQVEVAAREGGADMTANASLRTMYQKARDASVPMDTIERAIKRGTGEMDGVRYEPVNYEGYAPMGVAIYVETLTDNRNRTGADVRAIFSKNGGSSAEPGAVAWQFERKGVIVLPPGTPTPTGRERKDILLRVPNLPHASVPVGTSAADNVGVFALESNAPRVAPVPCTASGATTGRRRPWLWSASPSSSATGPA